MAVAAATCVGVAMALAQSSSEAPKPPPPVIVGRDAREGAQVIGKEFALRVRLVDVGGRGVQQVRVIRVQDDGTVTLPRIAPLKAEGVALAALETQATAEYKKITPTAAAFIAIADRNPPAPPATTQPATTQAGTTQAASGSASQPATAPAK